MNYKDLKTGVIYTDKLDGRVPLMFTGKITERIQYNSSVYIAEFAPVRTEDNKNWFDSMPFIHRAFDPECDRIEERM